MLVLVKLKTSKQLRTHLNSLWEYGKYLTVFTFYVFSLLVKKVRNFLL